MKQMTIKDFLTNQQITKCALLFSKYPNGEFAKQCHDQVILPNLNSINEKLGQENNPYYLAYAVQYCFIRLEQR